MSAPKRRSDDLMLPMGDTDPIENGRLVASAYLGRTVRPDEEIVLVQREIMLMARDERVMLDKIREEAERALGRPTFRVLDRILLILRGQA